MKKLLASMIVCGVWAAAEVPPVVAIHNAKIVTVSGPVIAKGTVVLRNGLIEAVGENVQVPGDAWVVEGDGLTVYPGLIDGLSTWGTTATAAAAATGGRGGGRGQQAATPAATQTAPVARSHGPEDRPSTSSWLKIADEVQTADRRLESARSAGFTAAASFPTRGIIAGQGALINLAGEKPGKMVLVPTLGQYMTMSTGGGFGGGFPNSLMGVISYIRQVYLDVDHYKLVKEAYARDPRGMNRPEYDRALEGIIESKRILLPANRVVEMDRMARFAAELKQPALLYGMREAFEDAAGPLLKKTNSTVLVSLKFPEKARDTDPDEVDTYKTLLQRDRAPAGAAMLQKAGVKYAFYSDGLDQPRDLQRAIKKTIDAGLTRDQAVRALTLSPAEIYGVSDRLGSIEKGKIANLVVTRGEIFDDRTKVEMVLIDGHKYTPAPDTTGPGGRGGAPTTDPVPQQQVRQEDKQ
jgi:hypothetical protein